MSAPPKRRDALSFTPADTVREALTRLTQAFSAANLKTPDIDARFLLRGLLRLDAGDFLRFPDRLLGNHAPALNEAAQRHLRHEPVSRILGEREFYGRAFEITPDVLDPRPDTETLIDTVLELVDRKGWRDRPLRIADIGLGSGAILITLLAELPLAQGTGTDISASALACASRNASRHRVDARFRALKANILEGVTEPFDIVVSNPPYIPSAEIAALEANVRDYDPALALDGGPDGLTIYREIHRQVSGLKTINHVVLEVGASQAVDVASLFGNSRDGAALWQAEYRSDLAGHVRCVALERQS